MNILVIESSPRKMGTGCGTVSMTKETRFPKQAYELGKLL